MKIKGTYSALDLAEIISCQVIGDESVKITGVNEMHSVSEGDLIYVDQQKSFEKAINSSASVILINEKVACPEGKALLFSENPFEDYNRLTKHFFPFIPPISNVGENTSIDTSALIYPNVFIGNNVIIKANVTLQAGVVVMDNTTIEEGVIVGPNTVIGHYAFYYKKQNDKYSRMHSVGGVHIKKNVEIGALCTIDAGVSSFTVIGEGTKIDNQVHIGHDTKIGAHCLFAANVGVAGCVTVEDRVTLWGQVGCASDVTLGTGCIVMAQSGISKSLAAGKSYFGSPCQEIGVIYRELAAVRRLPELIDRL